MGILPEQKMEFRGAQELIILWHMLIKTNMMAMF